MKRRRITIEVDQDVVDYLTNRPSSNTASALILTSRLVGAARVALIGAQPERCPTCEGVGCERCLTTGRRHLCKLVVAPTSTGRATIDLWQGAPGTMQLVATTVKDRDIASDTIDALLACLRDGGLIVDDKR